MRWDTRPDKGRALSMLKATGATSALVTFSGGNDEGGVDSIELIFSPTERREIEYTDERMWDPVQKRDVAYQVTPDQKTINALWDLLSAPVYDRYGSFAGEFYVSGQIVYDIPKWKMELTDAYEPDQGE